MTQSSRTRVGAAEARHEQVRRLVEAARRAGRHQGAGRRVERHAVLLVLGNLVAAADQPGVPVAADRRRSRRSVEHHRLRRVVQRRVEVGDVVRLRVDRLLILVAQPDFEAQVLLHAPGVRHVAAVLREAEEAERVVAAFGVGAEVAEQRVRERVAGRPRIAGRVEVDLAGVLVAAVLVLAVARDDHARPQRMRALDPRQVVRERDVGRRRQQRPGRTDDLRRRAGAGERDARNALDVVAAAIEHLRELEPVGLTFPVLTGRRNPLAVPRRGHLDVVEQVLP